MRWTLAIVFSLAGVASAQEEYKGKHFDCFGKDKAQVEKRGKQADEVGERFAKIMGITPKRGGVVLSGPGAPGGADGKKNGARWTFNWPESFGNFGNFPRQGMSGDMDPFTHELGHMIFVEHVNDRCDESLKKNFNGYGSYVKDWLDEAFACIQEPEGMKDVRRPQIKDHVARGDYIPLKKLFEMDHPMAGKKGPGDMPGGEFGGLGQNLGQMTEVNKFYVECLSVMEFLLDQYGEEFVRHVVDQHARAKNMADALKSYKGKLKKAKLAKDVDELEKQWVAWVKTR